MKKPTVGEKLWVFPLLPVPIKPKRAKVERVGRFYFYVEGLTTRFNLENFDSMESLPMSARRRKPKVAQ